MRGPQAPSDPVELMAGIFGPGHPGRIIRLKSIDPKEVVTYRRQARPSDYRTHLQASPVGALGLFPGFVGVEERCGDRVRRRWVCRWAVLDLDYPQDPEKALEIAAQWARRLRERGFEATFVSRGTTGRGSHLWLFFGDPQPQPLVYRALAAVASRIEEASGIRPELRPSAPYRAGAAVILPYIGALRDGIGLNPLLDPETYMPISLGKALYNRVLWGADDGALEALTREHVEERRRRAERIRTREEAWRDEVERVRREWENGRREVLALGLSGFGWHLRVDYREVESALHELARGEPESDRRRILSRLDYTWKRAQQGGAVSYRRWYEEAGLEPPTGPGKPRPAELEALRRRVQPTNPADLAVWHTILRLLEVHGRRTEDGQALTLAISQRALAEEAGVSKGAVYNALRRLGISVRARRKTSPAQLVIPLPVQVKNDQSKSSGAENPDGKGKNGEFVVQDGENCFGHSYTPSPSGGLGGTQTQGKVKNDQSNRGRGASGGYLRQIYRVLDALHAGKTLAEALSGLEGAARARVLTGLRPHLAELSREARAEVEDALAELAAVRKVRHQEERREFRIGRGSVGGSEGSEGRGEPEGDA